MAPSSTENASANSKSSGSSTSAAQTAAVAVPTILGGLVLLAYIIHVYVGKSTLTSLMNPSGGGSTARAGPSGMNFDEVYGFNDNIEMPSAPSQVQINPIHSDTHVDS